MAKPSSQNCIVYEADGGLLEAVGDSGGIPGELFDEVVELTVTCSHLELAKPMEMSRNGKLKRASLLARDPFAEGGIPGKLSKPMEIAKMNISGSSNGSRGRGGAPAA